MPRRKTGDILGRSDDKSSIDDYVIFENNRGYATDSKGRTWDIGSKASVEEAIKTGKVSEDLCPDHREALQIIIDERTEEGYYGGNKNTSRNHLDRTSVARATRNKQSNLRQTKAGKRTPIH